VAGMGFNPLGLLGALQYMSTPAKEVTPEIVSRVIGMIGIRTPSPELVERIATAIRTEDTETVASWLGTQSNFDKLRKMLKQEDPNSVIRCPHCNELIAMSVDVDALKDVSPTV